MSSLLALLESYAGYVKLLPGMVETVLALVESVKRLADDQGVEIPEIEDLQADNEMLRNLPDLAESTDSQPSQEQADVSATPQDKNGDT